MGPFLLVLITLLVIGFLVSGPFLAERRRRKIRARPFPSAWSAILGRRVPYVHRLPAPLRRQLEQHIQVFIAEKPFIGCDGQVIDDEVRVTIAAQACLLILNRKADYFPTLSQVLVYPSAFVVERVRAEPSGILQEERNALSGESWTHGQVVLSWEDALQGAAIDHDGRNVVIHEFAHQLDQQKGYANGAPYLGGRDRYPQWSAVLSHEFAMLQQRAMSGEPPLILSYYGATNPAEFFAVASEVFFEQPAAMATLHPALYDELKKLYRIDPLAW
jgi:Mlc titration factor MtfA (ptsG expression regulator)